jgi:hypothetical protein
VTRLQIFFLPWVAVGALLGVSTAIANSTLPLWVTKAIADHRATRSRDIIEEQNYGGKRAFEFTSGTQFDTGDEHVLFAEGGKQICRFGGYVGHVSRGECDLRKIKYIRTLYHP